MKNKRNFYPKPFELLECEKKKDKRLKEKYKISIFDYYEIEQEQNYKCACCGDELTNDAHIDHNHETGFIRGILCRKCNLGIGFFGDNPELLINVAHYLQGEFEYREPNRKHDGFD